MKLQNPIRYDFGVNALYTTLESQLIDKKTNQSLEIYGDIYLQLGHDLNAALYSQLITALQRHIKMELSTPITKEISHEIV